MPVYLAKFRMEGVAYGGKGGVRKIRASPAAVEATLRKIPRRRLDLFRLGLSTLGQKPRSVKVKQEGIHIVYRIDLPEPTRGSAASLLAAARYVAPEAYPDLAFFREGGEAFWLEAKAVDFRRDAPHIAFMRNYLASPAGCDVVKMRFSAAASSRGRHKGTDFVYTLIMKDGRQKTMVRKRHVVQRNSQID